MEHIETRKIFFHSYDELIKEQERLQKLSPKEILIEFKRLRMPYEHWNMFINGAFLARKETMEQKSKEAKNLALRNASEEQISLEKFQQIYKRFGKTIESKYQNKPISYFYSQDLCHNWSIIVDKTRPFSLFMEYYNLLDSLGVVVGLKSRLDWLKSAEIKNKNNKLKSLKTIYEDNMYMIEQNNIKISAFISNPEELVHYILSKMEKIIGYMDETYEGLETEKEFFKKVFNYLRENAKEIQEEITNIMNSKYFGKDITLVSDEEHDYFENILYKESNDLILESINHMLRVISGDEKSGKYDRFHTSKETIILNKSKEEVEPQIPFLEEREIYYGIDGKTFTTLDAALRYNELWPFIGKKI